MIESEEFGIGVLGNLISLLGIASFAQQKLSQLLCSILIKLIDLRRITFGAYLHNYCSQRKSYWLRRPVTEKSLSDRTPAASPLIRIHFQSGTQSLV